MYSHTPPPPPPKPASRMSTPSGTQSPRPPPPPPDPRTNPSSDPSSSTAQPERIPSDPGDSWLPLFLQDKSKQDLTTILSTPTHLTSLTHSPTTIHPSLAASHTRLSSALSENIARANALLEMESHLAHLRSQTQAQLLSTHALERQWRAKQAQMDRELGPFAPARLYQRLGQEVQEGEGVSRAMEESFLEGEGEATEREVAEWVRRYREVRKGQWLRRERKERWDEGRVGGWR